MCSLDKDVTFKRRLDLTFLATSGDPCCQAVVDANRHDKNHIMVLSQYLEWIQTVIKLQQMNECTRSMNENQSKSPPSIRQSILLCVGTAILDESDVP